MTSRPSNFHVKLRGYEVRLNTGDYLVGRGLSCHIVVADALVSRQHAKLTVTPSFVTILDLHTRNGTFVNGQRLGENAHTLNVGDRITLGKTAFTLGHSQSSGELPSEHEDTRGATFAETADEGQTARSDALELAGTAARQAMAEGRLEDAERFLSGCLSRLLEAARAGQSLAQGTQLQALGFALELAAASRKASWVDYALSFVSAAEPPFNEIWASPLKALAAELPVDRTEVVRLRSSLQARRASVSDARYLAWVEEVAAVCGPASR
jgi:hypothetical protein